MLLRRPRRTATFATLVISAACASTNGPPLSIEVDPLAAAASASAGSIGAAASEARESSGPALAALNSPADVEQARGPHGAVEFLGEATIVSGTRLNGTEVGGLSGITWAGGDRYVAISDDSGLHGAGRFYSLQIDLSNGRLEPDGVVLLGETGVLDPDRVPLAPSTFDMEGIARVADGTLYISSEGNARAGVPPFVNHVAADGTHLDAIELPARLKPNADGSIGVRPNLALESVAVTPDGQYLFTATENALQQDGPQADYANSSPSRLLKVDMRTGMTVAEFAYIIDPIPLAAEHSGLFHTSGLVDLIAVNAKHVLALERTFVAGAGFVARIYWACMEESANIIGIPSLRSTGVSGLPSLRKELFVDLSDIGIRIDNLEGMALGAPLPDGRRALVLISDNNFNARVQITQVLAFAVPGELVPPY